MFIYFIFNSQYSFFPTLLINSSIQLNELNPRLPISPTIPPANPPKNVPTSPNVLPNLPP